MMYTLILIFTLYSSVSSVVITQQYPDLTSCQLAGNIAKGTISTIRQSISLDGYICVPSERKNDDK